MMSILQLNFHRFESFRHCFLSCICIIMLGVRQIQYIIWFSESAFDCQMLCATLLLVEAAFQLLIMGDENELFLLLLLNIDWRLYISQSFIEPSKKRCFSLWLSLYPSTLFWKLQPDKPHLRWFCRVMLYASKVPLLHVSSALLLVLESTGSLARKMCFICSLSVTSSERKVALPY